MFFSNIDNPIGIDISDLSVKLVQLKKQSDGFKLAAYCDVMLPPDLIAHDVIKNKEGLRDFLRELLVNRKNHNGRFRGRSIVASVPESKAFVRVINLPMLEPKELAGAVPLEAEQYIPVPLNEIEIDWQVVGQTETGLKVLVTATPKVYVNDLFTVLHGAGLVPQAVEVESAAIVRCLLPLNGGTAPTLILDMDATRTSLIVYSDNSIQFTASVPIGGNMITQAIAQRLSVNPEEAEHIKRLHGIPIGALAGKRPARDVAELLSNIIQAVDPVLVNLYDEVKNTIKFHEGHNPPSNGQTNQITEVVLSGGTAKLPNLSEYLQGKILSDPEFAGRQIKVSIGDPWRNLFSAEPPPFSRREALSYTTSLGLALRNYV